MVMAGAMVVAVGRVAGQVVAVGRVAGQVMAAVMVAVVGARVVAGVPKGRVA